MVAGAAVTASAADRLRALAGAFALIDVAAALLVRVRSPSVQALFGGRGDLYAQWVSGALLAWGAVQGEAALRPTRQAARRVALLRGLLVAGDATVVFGADHAEGRRRALYAAATVVNAGASLSAFALSRRLP